MFEYDAFLGSFEIRAHLNGQRPLTRVRTCAISDSQHGITITNPCNY